MERIRRGFRLLSASWEVLKADKELLVFPVIAFVAIALATAVLGGLLWSQGAVDREGLRGFEYVEVGLFYFVTYFIGIFSNAAVVGAATIRLEGGDPSVSDGLRLASSKVGKIAGWAAVSATVGIILRSLEERAGFLGRLVITLVGAAWGAITFFVVPVLLYEPVGVFDSVKRSASLFKQRWGEQFVGAASIGLAMFVVSIPLVLLAVAIAALSPVVGVAVGILAIGTLVAVGTALSGVFNAALYHYATSGQAPGRFSPADLQGSFRPRRGPTTP